VIYIAEYWRRESSHGAAYDAMRIMSPQMAVNGQSLSPIAVRGYAQPVAVWRLA
jgi:hypothetical protein